MVKSGTTTKSEYFIPEQKQDDFHIDNLPAEVSATVETSELASFSLKPRKIRFLKPFAKLAGCTLMAISVWEMVRFVDSLMTIHPLLGLMATALVLSLLVMLLLALRSYKNSMSELASVNRFQHRSRQMTGEETFGKSTGFINDLKKLYEDKPHEKLLAKSVASLPDYSGDSEVLEHLSAHFLISLDDRAIEIVSRYSKQAGLLVALSPLAIADMLLSLWRMLKMVDEIAQVYGLRPSLPGRIRLMRKLFNAMALAGVSDMAADIIADYSSASLAGIVSTRMGQGIGVGLYVARVGIHTMGLCRPIPFNEQNRPRLKNVLLTLKPFIKERLKDVVTPAAQT